jgi:hypothetical protein
MKKTTIALSLGAGLGILLSASVASADELKDITCDQFLAMEQSQQRDIVYWISGIEAASSKKGATRRPRPLRGEWHAEIRVVGGIS